MPEASPLPKFMVLLGSSTSALNPESHAPEQEAKSDPHEWAGPPGQALPETSQEARYFADTMTTENVVHS